MLRPDQPASLKREEAMRILEELQRLQRSDRHTELLGRLRGVLHDAADRYALLASFGVGYEARPI